MDGGREGGGRGDERVRGEIEREGGGVQRKRKKRGRKRDEVNIGMGSTAIM